MGNISCPYCREEIKADAVLCRYCHSRLRSTLKEKVLSAIAARFSQIEGARIQSGWTFENVRCELSCKYRYAPETDELRDCLEECREAEAIAQVAEDLSRELNYTIIDIVWGGGDIDPVPFEKAVRERFSRPRGK